MKSSVSPSSRETPKFSMIGLYSYRTNNIGDDLQNFIPAEFLDTRTGSVWRDGAHSDQGPVTDRIINRFVTKEALPISPKIQPLMLAVWLGAQLLDNEEKTGRSAVPAASFLRPDFRPPDIPFILDPDLAGHGVGFARDWGTSRTEIVP